ncbi:MAG: ribosome maturation factor [Acidobacteria bacterium]|nr:MAG: ribosome maturation factor [Acidobacteriota bacterium]
MAVDIDHVRGIVERVAASLGVEVVELELRGGGKSRMLRVSTILDVEDAMPGGPYVLEVSSPGLDRKLSRAADFERFQGSRVKLTTKDPVNGNRHFEGRLEHFGGGRLTLDLAEARKKKRPQPDGEQKLEIELANVEKANLVPEI